MTDDFLEQFDTADIASAVAAADRTQELTTQRTSGGQSCQSCQVPGDPDPPLPPPNDHPPAETTEKHLNAVEAVRR